MHKSSEQLRVRVLDLRNLSERTGQRAQMRRLQQIINGGPEGLKALLGDGIQLDTDDLPSPNFIYAHVNRLAQKTGKMPTTKVAPPFSTDKRKGNRAAEKRERTILAWDRACRFPQKMPQVARWTAGYGFAAATIEEKQMGGYPYPHVTIHDPYDTFCGEWGPEQMPRDIMVLRRVPLHELVEDYPEKRAQLTAKNGGAQNNWVTAGVMGGTGDARGSWENHSGDGVEVVEYFDDAGHWLYVPEKDATLDFIANPLKSGPQFEVVKRFSFDDLISHYYHMIGPQASVARQSVLAEIAMIDAVFAETNVYGDPPKGAYERGRDAINYFDQNTKVERLRDNLPFQMFEHTNREERFARINGNYPVSDDGQSPNSFATGAGIGELEGAAAAEVREYQVAFADWFERLDFKRLEWMERRHPQKQLLIEGNRKGAAYSEFVVPDRDIAGNYRTRRVYGAMAAFEENAKIAQMLNLKGAGAFDTETLLENVDGVENATRILEKVRKERAETSLMAALEANAANGDPAARLALVRIFRGDDPRDVLIELFTPEAPQQSPETEAFLAAGQPQEAVAPPPPAEILARLAGGRATLGSQVQGAA